jgi:hypothetical protein
MTQKPITLQMFCSLKSFQEKRRVGKEQIKPKQLYTIYIFPLLSMIKGST